MGSFPALAIKQPESPLDQFAKVAQIRALLNGQQLSAAELQQHQLQNQALVMSLKGQQALRAAEQDPDWDPTDLDKSLRVMQKYSVPTDVAKNVISGISQIREGLGKASTENLKFVQDTHSFLDDQFNAVKSAPDDQKQNVYAQGIQNVKDYAAKLPPGPARDQMMQEIQNIPALYDPIYVTEQHAQLRSMTYLTEEALKRAQAREASGKGFQAEAEGAKTIAQIPGVQAESGIQQQNEAQGPTGRAMAGNLFYQAAGGSPQAKQALQLETAQKVAAAQAGVANVPPALKGVAPHLVGPASAAAEKAGDEYANAVAAANDMKTFVDLARSGNKVAYAYSPTEGVLTLNTARGVKRVNMAEIGSYAGAGSAADRLQAFFGKQLKGASIPEDVLNDMESLHESIAGNARTAYGNKLKNVNTTYGSSFQPVEMSRGQVTVTDPKGGVHTFPDQESADRFKQLAKIK